MYKRRNLQGFLYKCKKRFGFIFRVQEWEKVLGINSKENTSSISGTKEEFTEGLDFDDIW